MEKNTSHLERLPNALDQAVGDVSDVSEVLVDLVRNRMLGAPAEAARLGLP